MVHSPTGSLLQASSVGTAGGYGQLSGSAGAELYAGTFYQATGGVHCCVNATTGGVHCCVNATITLCVTLFADPVLANSSNLASVNPSMYALSIAAASKRKEEGEGLWEGFEHSVV